MVKLTPIGSEIESIIAAVIVFLAGGLLCFICCFAVTHIYLCYKRRMTRRRKRHEKQSEKLKEGEDASTYVILDEDAEFSSSDDDAGSKIEVKTLGSRQIKSHRSDRRKYTLTKEQIERINQETEKNDRNKRKS